MAVCNTVTVKHKRRTVSLQQLVTAHLPNVKVSTDKSVSSDLNESFLNEDPIDYQADSPDELALVQAAARYKIKLIESSETRITVKLENTTLTFERLMTFAFDSNRKRMSVLLRCPDGRIALFTKGADTAICSRLNEEIDIDIVIQHVDYFSRLGLRVLMLGYKYFTDDEYQAIQDKLQNAYKSAHADQQAQASVVL